MFKEERCTICETPCAATDAGLEVIERMTAPSEPAEAVDHSQTINALQKLIK